MAENNAQGELRLIACPHLLSIEKDRIDRLVPSGGTVFDHLREIGWTRDRLSARVLIDGVMVKDAAWEHTIPQAGQSLVVRAIPTGGAGGGGQGKDTVRIVAMIAVIAAAIAASVVTGGASFLALGPVWGAVAGAATSIVGSLRINSIMPPRQLLGYAEEIRT